MRETGFDNEKYVKIQSERIMERINEFGGKLYLEFGGKLFDDLHASRVLPGFKPDAKVSLLMSMKDKMEIIICISAPSIEAKKVRADYGITYDVEVLRMIDSLRAQGLMVSNIVITQYEHQPSAKLFKQKLEMRGEKVYLHTKTKGYPVDVETIVSEEGYGKNPFIETTKPLVILTAPGPGSGKLATCLSQLYHEFKRGNKAGYAKFETFPVWNLPLKHPINLAYEAATVDLKDVNMIDHFHLLAYGETSVNYNRDIDVFPVVSHILQKIMGECRYKSPTDMGVNMIGNCLIDDEVCQKAAKQEIIRRYFKTACDYKMGSVDEDTLQRAELLMKELGLSQKDRKVVVKAREKAEKTGKPTVAIELPHGEIITGKESDMLSASSACVLNCIKRLSDIKDDMLLLAPAVIQPMLDFKKSIGLSSTRLYLEETLMALSICGATNAMAAYAINKLPILRECQVHSSVILPPQDERMFRNLKVQVTSDPEYPTKKLYNL